MSAIDKAVDIPPAIVKLEQLLVWCLVTLHNLNKGVRYQETSGNAVDNGLASLIDMSIVDAADGTTRLLARVAIELNPDYRVDKTKKFWLFALEWSLAVIPAAYRAD